MNCLSFTSKDIPFFFLCLQFIKGAKSEGHAQASALAALGRYFEIVEKQQEQAQRCFKKALSVDPSIDVAGTVCCMHSLDDEEQWITAG